MQCDECGAREACVNFTVIYEGKKAVKRLCRVCARKLQRGDALSALTAVLSAIEAETRDALAPCPVCGKTAQDMLRTGRMGCAACYEAFAPVTRTALTRLDGTGWQAQADIKAEETKSAQSPREIKLNELRLALDGAVAEEAYERAAALRDEIKALAALPEGGEQA